MNFIFFPEAERLSADDLCIKLERQYPEHTIIRNDSERVIACVYLKSHFYFLKIYYDTKDHEVPQDFSDEITSLFKKITGQYTGIRSLLILSNKWYVFHHRGG